MNKFVQNKPKLSLSRSLSFTWSIFRGSIILILIGTILTIPSLLNGFPLVFSDTGTYIYSGFQLLIPEDRPINYGIFIWLFSFYKYPILIPIFQNIFSIAPLIRIQTIKKFTQLQKIITILFLVLFTPFIYYTNLVTPDFAIFPALTFLYLSYIESNTILKILSIIISFFLFSFHLGFIFPLILTIPAIALTALFSKSRVKHRNLLITIFLSTSLILFENYLQNKTYTFSKRGYLFVTAKLVGSDGFSEGVRDFCRENPKNLICNYVDSFPSNGSDFLWNSSSPLYKIGGWNYGEKEFKDLNLKLYTDPKYFKSTLKLIWQDLISQTFTINFGNEIDPYLENSAPYFSVKDYYPNYLEDYLDSLQNSSELKRKLPRDFFNYLYFAILLSSYLFILYFILSPNKMELSIYLISSYFISSLLFISMFSIPDSRYLTRLLPVLVFFIFISLISLKNQKSLIENNS
ncbi:MAG: hypothetical protein L6Q78_11835 [Bacteroidia bacterium]|nr:hypothetical protein [Bacteroidia bacterium]